MRSDAPREGNDVDAVLRLISSIHPLRILVVNDPLKTVHCRFIEFLLENIVFERPGACVRTNSNINQCCVRCRTIESSLLTVGIDSCCSSHTHASCTVLVPVIRVKRTIGFTQSTASSDANWIRRCVTHCVIACDKFFIEPGVFVIDTGIDHCDVDSSTADTQVPCTLWVNRRIACFDCGCLNIPVEND